LASEGERGNFWVKSLPHNLTWQLSSSFKVLLKGEEMDHFGTITWRAIFARIICRTDGKQINLWAKDIQNNESVDFSTGYGGRDHLSCLFCMVMPRQE
jgi:hypothetical protein